MQIREHIIIEIRLKIFDKVIQPIALNGSEVWVISHQSYTSWDKHPTKSLHAEFCRYILHVHRNTPTNRTNRAELRRYPLWINIQKTMLNFVNHLKSSPRNTLHSKALQTQELSPEKRPLCQLVLRLTAPFQTQSDQPHNNTALQTAIRVKQIITQCN